jgi:hypothetical protein
MRGADQILAGIVEEGTLEPVEFDGLMSTPVEVGKVVAPVTDHKSRNLSGRA